MKSGNHNFLEPSGPLQACNGTALPLLCTLSYSSETEISVFGCNLNRVHILLLICHAIFSVLSCTLKETCLENLCPQYDPVVISVSTAIQGKFVKTSLHKCGYGMNKATMNVGFSHFGKIK